MGNYCRTCSFWGDPINGSISTEAVCSNPAVELEVQIEHLENNDDDSVIFTSAWFGCIHYRDRPTTLIDIKKELENDRT